MLDGEDLNAIYVGKKMQNKEDGMNHLFLMQSM